LDLADSLRLIPREKGISFSFRGPDLGPDEDNLVVQAARMFQERAGPDCGIELFLDKRIPVRGGLGGGSSDAAATLKGMDALYPGRVDRKELAVMAGDLGADVPFFLSPSPLALAWGRGDRVLPLSPLPPAPLLLAVPPVQVETSRAFGLLAASREGRPPKGLAEIVDPDHLASWSGVAGLSVNDFEGVIFSAFPILGKIAEALRDQEPRMVRLTGSGSALYAVFRERRDVDRAASALGREFPDVGLQACRTLETIPGPDAWDRG
jgi:4-diphosphocytidyl-2-C-methyl-D-erythritol kinase